MTTTLALAERAEVLRARLEKEIARYAAQPGTMRRGEIAAVSIDLEVLLRHTARWIAQQAMIDVRREIRASGAQKLQTATLGQLVGFLAHLSKIAPQAARLPEVRELCRDAGIRRGSLETFRQVRSAAAHETDPPPPPHKLIPVLHGLHSLIERHRRAAGWDG